MQMGNILENVWGLLCFCAAQLLVTCIVVWCQVFVQYKTIKWVSAQREFNNPRMFLCCQTRKINPAKLTAFTVLNMPPKESNILYQSEGNVTENTEVEWIVCLSELGNSFLVFQYTDLCLLLWMIWQSPGLPGWRKVNFITMTRRPHHPNSAGLYCLATSPGFLPTLCEKWSGFFYVHKLFLSYTRDQWLKVSSERLGNEDKAPCPRTLLPGRGPTGDLRYGSPRL